MHYITLMAAVTAAWTFGLAASYSANIIDFNTWTEVQDPPHAGMTSNVDSASQVTLTASGAIPAGTDIGYQSVNGTDVSSSSSGHYFSTGADFQVAIDFDLMAANSVGLGGIGFGIGEDSAGTNSAGVALAILNGSPTLYSGAARVNDVTQAPLTLALSASSTGRFFVHYDSANGDITVGVSNTPGALTPDATNTFSGANVQNNWAGDDLLVSFFLRSDSVVFPPLSAGTLEVVFSNFEVLSGTSIAVPEPGSAALCIIGMMLLRFRSTHEWFF